MVKGCTKCIVRMTHNKGGAMFDFAILQRMTFKAWIKLVGDIHEQYSGWDVRDALKVFKLYCDMYAEKFGKEPPHLTQKAVDWIISELPFCDDLVFDPDDYGLMLEKYFDTRFEACNYSLAHFMSGEIRLNRYYETLF